METPASLTGHAASEAGWPYAESAEGVDKAGCHELLDGCSWDRSVTKLKRWGQNVPRTMAKQATKVAASCS